MKNKIRRAQTFLVIISSRAEHVNRDRVPDSHLDIKNSFIGLCQYRLLSSRWICVVKRGACAFPRDVSFQYCVNEF